MPLRRLQLVALMLLCGPITLGAQDVRIGREITFHSDVLREDRPLLVHLPESYETSTFRYPVLYLLDAESDFLHTVGIVEFLAGTDQIPELIVVGIENTHRSRDLTPPSSNREETEFWDEVGGAASFRRFLENELLPAIESRYRTEPFRILRGQSFGGLFAVYDLLTSGPTFEAYLVSSPAVGWNHDELVRAAGRARELPAFLYLASGGRDFPATLAAIRRFVDALAPDERAWRQEFFPEERHYSVVHPATWNGLRWLYADWQPPDEVERSGDFQAFLRHYEELSTRYGYEIKIPMRAVVRLGNQLLRERRFDEGIAVLRRNLELYPGQPESHWHVGDAYVLAGRSDEARRHFRRALELAEAMGVPDVERYRESFEAADTATSN